MKINDIYQKIIFPKRIDQLINYMSPYYYDNNNFYSTINHITNMYCTLFKHLDDFKNENPKWHENEFDAVEIAIAFHDAIYTAKNKFYNDLMGYALYKTKCYLDIINLYNKEKMLNYLIEKCIIIVNSIHKNPSTFYEKVIYDLHNVELINFDKILKRHEKLLNEYLFLNKLEKTSLTKEIYMSFMSYQLKYYNLMLSKPIFYTKTFNKFNEIAKNNLNKYLDLLINDKI